MDDERWVDGQIVVGSRVGGSADGSMGDMVDMEMDGCVTDE